MRKVQWRRLLAAMMALLLFVGDAPAVMAMPQDEGQAVSVTTVSGNEPKLYTNSGEETLGLDTFQTVTVSTYEESVYYQFTPETTGRYVLHMYGNCWGPLYDVNKSYISGNTYFLNDGSCVSTNVLEAGQTYYYEIYSYDESVTSCEVRLTQVPQITAVDMVCGTQDIVFYYGISTIASYLVDGLVLRVTLSNGEAMDVEPGDDNYQIYGINDAFVTPEGYLPTPDELGCTPAGEYQFMFTVPDLTEPVCYPCTVVDYREIATEMAVDNYYVAQVQPTGQSVFYKYTPTVTGIYNLGVTNNKWCDITLYHEDMGQITGVTDLAAMLSWELEAGETYYYQVSASEKIGLEFTKQPSITEIELLEPVRTEFYRLYEHAALHYAEFMVTLDNGEEVEIELYDENWHGYGLSCALMNGNDEEVFDASTLTAGSYRWEITATASEAKLEIPFQVVEVDDVAAEISLDTGETVTIDTAEKWMWYQFSPAEPGAYQLTVTGDYYICAYLYNEEIDYIISNNGRGCSLQHNMKADETFYFLITTGSGEAGSIELQLTKVPMVTGITQLKAPNRTTHYYGLVYPDIDGLKIQLTVDDGQELEAEPWDRNWNAYGVEYDSLTRAGAEVEYDEYGRYPVGEYKWVIRVPGVEEPLMVNFEVADPKETIPEITVGAEATVEIATSGQEVWYQFTPETTGMYSLVGTETDDIYVSLYNEAGMPSGETWVSADTALSDKLDAGETYYYRFRMMEEGTGTYGMLLSKEKMVTSMEVSQMPISTTSYYGVNGPDINGLMLNLTFDDGEELEILPWSSEWYRYGLACAEQTKEGGYIEYDDYGRYPVGEYQWVIHGTDIEEQFIIPFVVVEPEGNIPVLEEGVAYSVDLERPMQYAWCAFTPQETGKYSITVATENMLRVYLYDSVGGFGGTDWLDDGEKVTYTLEAGRTYYYQVQMDSNYHTGSVVLTIAKEPEITEIELVEAPYRNRFICGMEDPRPEGLVVNIVWDNGQEVEATLWDQAWNANNLTYSVSTSATTGELVESDEYGMLPVGEYLWEIYVLGSDVKLSIPYSIISPEDIELQLAVDSPLECIEANVDENWDGVPTWFKVVVEKGGIYKYNISYHIFGGSYTIVTYNAECEVISYSENVEFAEAGTYYTYVYCQQDLSVGLEKLPVVTELELDYRCGNGIYYQGFISSEPINDVQVSYTLDDGTTGTTEILSAKYSELGMYSVLNAENSYDEDGYLLVGEYLYTVYDITGEVSADVRITVKDRAEMPALTVGQTLEGLQSADFAKSYFKVVVEEAGKYLLNIPFSNCQYNMAVIDENGERQGGWTYDNWIFETNGPATYYVQLATHNYDEEYAVTLSKFEAPTEIEVIGVKDVLVAGLWDNNVYNMLDEALYTIKLTFPDGSKMDMKRWDSTWYQYGFAYQVYNDNGQPISEYDIPVGEYILKIYSTQFESAFLDIPFTVIELDETDTVTLDEVICLEPGTEVIYQMDIPGNGAYQLEDVEGSNAFIGIYDSEQNWLYSIDVEEGAEYNPFSLCGSKVYIRLGNYNAEDALEFTIHKLPDIASLSKEEETITFSYGSWGYHVGETVSGGMSVGEEYITPKEPNTELSEVALDNGRTFWFDISLDAVLSDETVQEIFYNTSLWKAYNFFDQIFSADGSEVYTDHNGYVEIGDYFAQFTANGRTVSVPFSVTESETVKDLRKATIAFPYSNYAGVPVTPIPTVTYNGVVLVKDVDYIITYENNNQVGTATATLKGIGNYSGTRTTNFTINPAVNYKITYNLNGGKNNSANPSTYTINTATITLKNPSRTGYTFGGWYSDSKLTKKVTSIAKGSTGNRTLYAKWTAAKYTITYNLNSGKNNASNPKSYTIATATISLKAPTRTGYTFGGWYSDKKLTKKVTSIAKGSTGNKTLYAKWTANKYTIKFNANGGKGTTKQVNATYGTSAKLTKNGFKRTGYTFTGWNTKKNGKGTSYKKTASVKNLTDKKNGSVTLYAQWTADKYKITYNLNGGKNHKNNPKTYTVAQAVKLKNPTKTGYVFKGWYSDKKLTKKVTQIKKGSTGNVKLYAKWVKK